MAAPAHPAFEPLRIGRLALKNRVVKTARYEGMVVRADTVAPLRAITDAVPLHGERRAGEVRRRMHLTVCRAARRAP